MWRRAHNINSQTVASKITIALAQVKAGNASVNLLNEIRQIKCFLYQAKEIIKKV